MASRKKERPLRGNGRDGADYSEFMAGLLDGSIRATALTDTTVPDGNQQVHVPTFVADPTGPIDRVDENGVHTQGRFDDVIVTVNKRRLTKLEYDDPDPDRPGQQAQAQAQGKAER